MDLMEACTLSVDHLAQFGCSDITKANLESELITKYRTDFIDLVQKKLKCGHIDQMNFKPIQYLLTPKNRYVFDYRKAAIVEPECLAKYTALVLLAAEDIEKARIPADEKIVFSSRFAPSGADLFSKNVTYSNWRERIKELAVDSNCAYIVQCDIASFYDRVNIHRLESTLLAINVNKELVSQINNLLLFWSRKDSYGLPVGNTASRILAEAALIDIDKNLMSEEVKFVRYVDDYRLFAPDLITAQRWMNLLTNRLFRDGLMLNTGKTKLYLAAKNEELQSGLKDNDEPETIIRKVTMLTGGYNRIARTFIMPAEAKYDAFAKIDVDAEICTLENQCIPEFEGIQKLIVACLVKGRFDKLEQIALFCSRFLYSLDYFVDMLIKNCEVIPPENQRRIADSYLQLILSSRFGGLDWHLATLAHLLSHPKYFRKKALFHIVKSQTKENVTYPSIIAMEGLSGKLSREEFLTLRELFNRCDDWEKRRMIVVSSSLPLRERKSWARAIKPIVQSDFFNSILVNEITSGN